MLEKHCLNPAMHHTPAPAPTMVPDSGTLFACSLLISLPFPRHNRRLTMLVYVPHSIEFAHVPEVPPDQPPQTPPQRPPESDPPDPTEIPQDDPNDIPPPGEPEPDIDLPPPEAPPAVREPPQPGHPPERV